jgi:hypothetical protein
MFVVTQPVGFFRPKPEGLFLVQRHFAQGRFESRDQLTGPHFDLKGLAPFAGIEDAAIVKGAFVVNADKKTIFDFLHLKLLGKD